MIASKKPKQESKPKLTPKQKKLVEALPTSDSVAQAGKRAGYSDRKAAHRALKNVSERAPEVLERLGLTVEHVVDKCLRPLMEAKETKFFANQGVVLDSREVEALDIRLRAVDLWARLMGAYTPAKVQVSGGLTVDLGNLSDDELDKTIYDLISSSQPPTGN
jgi:hypothetical protein